MAFRAGLFFALAIALASFINRTASPDRLATGTLVSVLIGIGAMFGGVLAIVFALSNFMQQNAAELYSSQFYEVYARDRREKLVFSAIACLTVLSFGLAVLQDMARVPLRQSVVVCLILSMTAAVFGLVDWQYSLVTRKINPLYALAFLERQCLRSLSTVHSLAKDVASWLRLADDKLTDNQALAVSYGRFAAPCVAAVDSQLENVVEISLRLSAKGELLATRRGLVAIHNVLTKYLQLRGESSLAVAAGPYWRALESDSQSFLAKNFERLNAAGERLLDRRESQAAVFVMDLYASLVESAKEMQFLNRPGQNPILDQLRAYSSGLLDSAIRANDLEVCFRSINVSKAIGNAAVARRLSATTLYGVYGDLTKVATWAITNRKVLFVEHCTAVTVALTASCIEADTPGLESQLGEALRHLQDTTLALYVAAAAGITPATMPSDFMVGKCYVQMEDALVGLVQRFEATVEGAEKATFASNLIRLFEELYRSLRGLSELLKNCDAPVVFNIASLLDRALELLVVLSVEATDIQRRDAFERQLHWYLHLPFWFVEHSASFTSTNAFDTLADIPAKTGLLLLHRKAWPTHSTDCVKAAFSITREMLAKATGTHAYDEPRHMLSVCYMGVLTLKLDGLGSMTMSEVVRSIRIFEQLYRDRYFVSFTPPDAPYLGPRPEQLLIEVLRWRDDFIREYLNPVPLGDRSRDIVGQLINEADIDRFIFEVWAVVPTHSSVADELEEKRARRIAMGNLLQLLRAELARRD